MNKLCFVFFLICSVSFSQNLEDAIYNAAETFIHNKNETSLKFLIQKESIFKNQVKTKDEQLALVFLQCHKAHYLDEHSKLKEAIATYEDALKRFNNNELSKFSDFDIIENCLKPLGNLYTKTGDYTNAVSTINQYLYLAEKNKNTKHKISGAINLAKLYQTLNKHETVLKIIEDASKLPNINKYQIELLQSIKINSLLVLNKYKEAHVLQSTDLLSAFETYKNQYTIAIQKNDYVGALKSFKKAKEHLDKANLTPRDLAKFYIEEARLYHLLKQPNNALKSLEQAGRILLPNFNKNKLPDQKDLYAENTFIDLFDLFAVIQNNTDTALKSYNLSFYVSELLQENWTSQEAKIFNTTNNRIRSEKCIDLLVNKYQQTNNKLFLFEAFQYSENNKASVLKDMYNKKMRLQQFPNDSLLIKEYDLLKTQEYYTGLLIKEQLGANKASIINRLSEKLSDISLQLKTIKTAISKTYPEKTNSLSLETLQKKLKEDYAVLIEYFFGNNTLYQFVISENDIEVERIELNTNIKRTIVNFIHLFDDASIINNDINIYTNQAFNVFELLKFNNISTYKNVVIIPDGLLNFIPFEALLTAKTTTTTFSKMPFVVKSHHVVYNSSATFYLITNKKDSNKGLLGFFPVFENTNQKLTYSINEAEAIKKEMNSDILMHSKASKTNFLNRASKYSILHLSTHASSGDFINPAHISFYDDTIILNELYSLDLNPNLVVLSACETGVGKLYKGEGAMSIARGFQYAGAENLLFSLWQINDLSTSQIMQSFYKHYNKQQSAFIANHHSKLEYLANQTISNIKKSPYYWSAFVYYGTLEKAKAYHPLFYITFGIIILLIVLLLFLKLNKS
jgi:CHAT domain-containing protein